MRRWLVERFFAWIQWQRRILQSGDEQLVRILRILPEESFARLKGILQQS
jgi:hypothetical protein